MTNKKKANSVNLPKGKRKTANREEAKHTAKVKPKEKRKTETKPKAKAKSRDQKIKDEYWKAFEPFSRTLPKSMQYSNKVVFLPLAFMIAFTFGLLTAYFYAHDSYVNAAVSGLALLAYIFVMLSDRLHDLFINLIQGKNR